MTRTALGPTSASRWATRASRAADLHRTTFFGSDFLLSRPPLGDVAKSGRQNAAHRGLRKTSSLWGPKRAKTTESGLLMVLGALLAKPSSNIFRRHERCGCNAPFGRVWARSGTEFFSFRHPKKLFLPPFWAVQGLGPQGHCQVRLSKILQKHTFFFLGF